MIKTRSKKILRDMAARRGRSMLAILSIAIGVFGVATMVSITDLIVRQTAEDVWPSHISHTQLYVISSTPAIAAAENQAALQTIKELPGVTDAEGQAVFPVKWQKDGQGREESDFLIAFSEPFGQNDLMPIVKLSAGRYPVAGQGEIAVEQRFADTHGLALGDRLTFPNTDGQAWEIVGLAIHPFFASAGETAVMVPERIFAAYPDAQQIAGFAGLSTLHVRYTDLDTAQDGLHTLTDTVGAETPYVVVLAGRDDPDGDFLTSVVEDMTAAMSMLGVIAMVVSGFLVTNVMNTIVVEQRKQIGVMKAIGATFWDSFFIYAGMALVYGLIGTALGLALAVPVAANAARPMADWLGIYIEGLRLSPLGLGIGATMGLLVPVLAALLPVWLSARVSILRAMTDRGITSSWGQSRLSRWIGGLPLPTAISQALANIWNRKGRLTLTALTLTVAVGAFMASTALADTLDTFIKKGFSTYGYEIRITPQQAEELDAIAQLIEESGSGVGQVYRAFDSTVAIPGFVSDEPLSEGSRQVPAYGFETGSGAYQFELDEGRTWHAGETEGVVISRTVARVLGKGAGDPIAVQANGQTWQTTILGVESFSFDAIYLNWRQLASLAGYVDEETGEPAAAALLVDLKGEPSIQKVDDEITAISQRLDEEGIAATFINQPQAAKTMGEEAAVLGIIFGLMSVVMAAVGAVGLMAALSIAVFERQKEIGVMRSIGARSRTIMGQFMLEGVLVAVFAWLLAIPLSVWLSQGLLTTLPFKDMELIYPPYLLLMGLSGVLLVAALASLWPSLSASRKTVADILRYQ